MDSVLKKSDSLHQLAQLHITMGTCIHGVTWHAEFMKHLCIDLWVWCKHISSWQSAGGCHVSHPRAQHLPRLWDDSRLSNELPHPEGQKVYTVHKLFFYYVQTHVHLSSCLIILSYTLITHGASWQYSTHKSPSVFLTPSLFFSVQALPRLFGSLRSLQTNLLASEYVLFAGLTTSPIPMCSQITELTQIRPLTSLNSHRNSSVVFPRAQIRMQVESNPRHLHTPAMKRRPENIFDSPMRCLTRSCGLDFRSLQHLA